MSAISGGVSVPEQISVDGPARFWLNSENVQFELREGNKVILGVMSAPDFIETFSRAAEIAHQWSCEHFRYDGIVRTNASPQM